MFKSNQDNHSPSFLKQGVIHNKEVLVPSVVFAFVLQILLMSLFEYADGFVSGISLILLEASSMALLTYLAIRLFVIPKLNAQQQQYNHDTQSLLATIDKHCIFATVAANGTILHANQKFADVSGYRIEELVGQNHRILNSGHFSKHDWKDFYKTLSQGKVWQGNIRNRTKNGTLYWVFTTVYPVFKEGKLEGYFTLRSEITDIVNRAEQSMQLVEELQQTEQRLSDFTNHIVHELRTPIHIITNFNHILFDQMQQQRNIALLKQSQEVVDHMSGLVNELLDNAKIKEGKLTIHNEEVDLVSMLTKIHHELALSAAASEVEVVLDIDGDFPHMVMCDKLRIKQVIYNLTSNALKFTQQGAITISAEFLANPVATKHSLLRIAVSDTGIGMEASDLKQIFNEFFQVDNKKAGHGTGLGLTISKRLIELMGGDLTASSTYGKGSEFVITLPYVAATSSPKVAAVNHSEVSMFDEHTLNGYRLVVVDDLPTNVLIADAILSRYGAHVSTFINPQNALDYMLLNPTKVDAVITDFNMPEMTGVDLASAVRRIDGLENISIFALSGAIGEEIEPFKGEASPITAWLSKPLEIREIINALLQYQKQPVVTHTHDSLRL